MKTIAPFEILPLIQGGKFFAIDFHKKDGSFRTINGRLGVSRYVNGKGLKFDPASKGMIVVWEAQKGNRKTEDDKGYRMVTLSRVTRLRVGGEKYSVRPYMSSSDFVNDLAVSRTMNFV